jgi:hypothetical protein
VTTKVSPEAPASLSGLMSNSLLEDCMTLLLEKRHGLWRLFDCETPPLTGILTFEVDA